MKAIYLLKTVIHFLNHEGTDVYECKEGINMGTQADYDCITIHKNGEIIYNIFLGAHVYQDSPKIVEEKIERELWRGIQYLIAEGLKTINKP